jgi:hypothetical protein
MKQTSGRKLNSRRSKIQVLDLLREYERSPGMAVKAFCKLHQISEGSFYAMRKRHRSAITLKPSSSGFIAIERPAFKEATGSLFAEVNGIKLYQAVPADYLKSLIV